VSVFRTVQSESTGTRLLEPPSRAIA